MQMISRNIEKSVSVEYQVMRIDYTILTLFQTIDKLTSTKSLMRQFRHQNSFLKPIIAVEHAFRHCRPFFFRTIPADFLLWFRL